MGIVEDAQGSAEWMAQALSTSGYTADFGTSSLWEIERSFDEQAPDGQPRKGGLLWEGDDADPKAEINVALVLHDGSRICPVQRVMKRFSNGSEDGVLAYAAARGLAIGERSTPSPPARKRRRLGR